jgi:hypothetical protein
MLTCPRDACFWAKIGLGEWKSLLPVARHQIPRRTQHANAAIELSIVLRCCFAVQIYRVSAAEGQLTPKFLRPTQIAGRPLGYVEQWSDLAAFAAHNGTGREVNQARSLFIAVCSELSQ